DNYATDFLYVSLHSRPVYQPRQHLQLLVLQQKEKNQPQISPTAQAYSCIQQVRKNARPWNKTSHIKFRL
ncbi:TPA: hypothetical protein ACJXNL_004960, partial [Salmonella enterica subsp. enterica serovar Livingstone]